MDSECFYLSSNEVTETDGSKAWAIMKHYPPYSSSGYDHLFEIGFNSYEDAKERCDQLNKKFNLVTYKT